MMKIFWWKLTPPPPLLPLYSYKFNAPFFGYFLWGWCWNLFHIMTLSHILKTTGLPTKLSKITLLDEINVIKQGTLGTLQVLFYVFWYVFFLQDTPFPQLYGKKIIITCCKYIFFILLDHQKYGFIYFSKS